MRRFLASLVLIAASALASDAGAQTAEWKLYDMTHPGLDKMYYQEAGIARLSGHVLKVPTRVLHSPESVKDYAEKSGAKYQDLKETQSLMEIDCRDRKWRALTGVNVDSKGTVIDRAEKATEWEAVIPESTMESLLKEVCPRTADGERAGGDPRGSESGKKKP